MVSEEHREGVGFIAFHSSCANVGCKAHFEGNPLVDDVGGKGSHLDDLSVFYGHILHYSGAVADSVCMADLDCLPDGFQAEGFSCVDSDVEVLASDVVEGFQVLLWRMAAFVSCQVEAHHSSVGEGNGKFCNFH